MKITREERLYLNDLSLKVFGTASKWYKMINNGEVAKLTRKLEDGTEERYNGISYYTIDEIKKNMEEIWAKELEAKAANEKAALESAKTIETKLESKNE